MKGQVKTSPSYANGYQPRRLNTSSGMLIIEAPETAKQRDTPFYPSALKRGQLNREAIQEAIATAYFQGASTRNVGEIFKCFGLESVVYPPLTSQQGR